MVGLDGKKILQFITGLAASVLTIIVIFLLLEVFIRVVFPQITPIEIAHELLVDNRFGDTPGLRPMSSGYVNGTIVTIDPLGFIKYTRNAGTYNQSWLFLGDGVTMGAGIEPDSTFAGRIWTYCNELRILNASLVGYSSWDFQNVGRGILLSRQDSIRRLNIQHVSVLWSLRDIYSNYDFGMSPGDDIRESGSSLAGFMKKNFRAYTWIDNLFNDRAKEYYDYDRRIYQSGDPRFKKALADLCNLKGLCDERNIQFDVILIPYEYQFRSPEPERDRFAPQQFLSKALDGVGIRHYDAAPAFAAAQQIKSLYLNGDGMHLSDQGHVVMTRYMMETFYCR